VCILFEKRAVTKKYPSFESFFVFRARFFKTNFIYSFTFPHANKRNDTTNLLRFRQPTKLRLSDDSETRGTPNVSGMCCRTCVPSQPRRRIEFSALGPLDPADWTNTIKKIPNVIYRVRSKNDRRRITIDSSSKQVPFLTVIFVSRT